MKGDNMEPKPSTRTDDGGPASSMSKRDEFAKAAMQGILAGSCGGCSGTKCDECSVSMAKTAYGHADAMIAERSKERAK